MAGELCTNIRFAREGEMPPVACTIGQNVKLLNGVVFTPHGCPLWEGGFTDWHCRRTAEPLPVSNKMLPPQSEHRLGGTVFSER